MAGLSSTKSLAKRLGLLKRSSSGLPSGFKESPHQLFTNDRTTKNPSQIFKYIFVLDFESTCWKDKENSFGQEVIEFPVVLLNTETGEIEDQFHQYVQPTEHSKLSAFCTELTGIQQDVVDNSVPIGVCLRLFTHWLQKHIDEKRMWFPSLLKTQLEGEGRAVFATWSDWDLNTCLQYECKRKGISYSAHLKTWIDLRKTFRTFYNCYPQGLNGALSRVGIKFEGREHSGIDDATNTACLVRKMMADGCIMKATKSLIVPLEICNNPREPSGLSKRVRASEVSLTTKTNISTSTSKSSRLSFPLKLKQNHLLGLHSATETNNPAAEIVVSKNTPTGPSTKQQINNQEASITITPPLCHCGRSCKRKKVVNPGPNTGRVFFTCPAVQRRHGSDENTSSEECKFFKWESAMLNSPNDQTCKTLFK